MRRVPGAPGFAALERLRWVTEALERSGADLYGPITISALFGPA